ncbi:MAG: proline--tRNA ligase [Alphaproteobacteria bacterium]|nr:proline--tRNA ligase [Alphaproteobacteria bacterium]
MRLSRYFLPTLKEVPKEAEIASHRLMLRAGMIRQESAGIYSWLPLGYSVLKKIEIIVRREQDRAGFVEMLMPTIQPADLWRFSGRYDDYGKEMLRIQDRHQNEMLYGPTNEEMITNLFKATARSYRDVPKRLYHIQWKFRDELRPRFGVMRGREFLMKDAYSFDYDVAGARRSYYRQFIAYLRIFSSFGLKAIPMIADTGPIGGDLSHEFLVLANTGESSIFCDKALIGQSIPGDNIDYEREDLEELAKAWTGKYAATEEKHDPYQFESEVSPDHRLTARGIEVGHIFYFGSKYSEPMRAFLQTREKGQVPLQMGSYGIGISRLIGAIIEVFHDESGIIWPESVAPFHVGIINLKQGDTGVDSLCERLYAQCLSTGIEVLYDDTGERAGSKFKNMDLIGLPWQLIVGPNGLSSNLVEFKHRLTGAIELLSPESAINKLVHGR